jgi:hypothetical protein
MYIIQYSNNYMFGYVYMDMYIMPCLSASVQYIYRQKMNDKCLCDVYSVYIPIFTHRTLVLVLMVAVQCVCVMCLH